MIYFDYAATTPVKTDVLTAMQPYFTEHWENPSARSGQAAYVTSQIQAARSQVAESIHAKPEEIYFTSGGTEADNWVIKCIPDICNIITTPIEHSAVYHSCMDMQAGGVKVCYVPVDRCGRIDELRLSELLAQTDGSKTLVSVIYANNEIGTIQRIGRLVKLAHKNNALFHTDAVQAYGQLPLDVRELDIDFLSASGHKIGAPKGIGFLYKRAGIPFKPLLHGGKQENSLRGGTENVPYIIGMGAAASMIPGSGKHESIANLRDYTIARILTEIPSAILNGAPSSDRLPNNMNISFKDIYGESLQMILENSGYVVSNGSACNAGVETGSRVLHAIGVPEDYIYGTIRITLAQEHTKADIDCFVDTLKVLVRVLRGEI